MGKVISTIKHPFRNFNVESRAHKLIGQEIKKAAPKFEKDAMDLKRIIEQYPEEFQASLRKNEILDKHLKDVYVTSHDSPDIKKPESRPLPQDRAQPEQYLFGHKEPDKIPIGKSTLRNVLQFISQHQNDPINYTPSVIAEKHKLDEDLVKKIVKYYRVFEIYIPDMPGNTKATFAGPARIKVQLLKSTQKTLSDPESSKKVKDET